MYDTNIFDKARKHSNLGDILETKLGAIMENLMYEVCPEKVQPFLIE